MVSVCRLLRTDSDVGATEALLLMAVGAAVDVEGRVEGRDVFTRPWVEAMEVCFWKLFSWMALKSGMAPAFRVVWDLVGLLGTTLPLDREGGTFWLFWFGLPELVVVWDMLARFVRLERSVFLVRWETEANGRRN